MLRPTSSSCSSSSSSSSSSDTERPSSIDLLRRVEETVTLLRPEPRHDSPLLHSPTPVGSPLPAGPAPPMTWAQKIRHTWLMSKGMLMVMLAQFFGASMNTMTRTLQLDGPHGEGMNPFQILFVRMFATVVCSAIYMWYAKVPHPFGVREVRSLLVLRGVSGFLGVFGLYYSLAFLPLSEATVLTFLAPILCCYACSLVMPGEVFTRKQQLAGVLSLVGVILIARPMSLFFNGTGVSPEAFIPDSAALSISNAMADEPDIPAHTPKEVSPEERFIAILAALVGVIGATLAYTCIRKIGQRAHPLVSVTYFSSLTTIISLFAVLLLPSVSFRLPGNWTECLLLFGLGSCGFLLQFLLTAGLAYVPPPSVTNAPRTSTNIGGAEKKKTSSHGSRATSMVYTQMLFALFYDKVVWDSTPSPMSWAGSAIILCSALYVALAKDDGGKSKKDRDGDSRNVGEDEDTHVDLETGVKSGFAARWSRFWNRGRRQHRFEEEEEEGDRENVDRATSWGRFRFWGLGRLEDEHGHANGYVETDPKPKLGASWGRFWAWGRRRARFGAEDGHHEERRGLLNGDEDEDDEHEIGRRDW